MPVIVITGTPASGKSNTTKELKTYFEGKGKKVKVICENDVIKNMKIPKNDIYMDSKREKEVRSVIKSDYLRVINPEGVTIIDSLNYIKGYRYEIYCATKSSKTTQCTVHCELNSEKSWDYNISRSEEEQYNREVFDALLLRFETPDSRDRWDSPLFMVLPDKAIPFEDIENALFNRKPPPPNQSTQCPPLSDTNYLYQVDCVTQEVISSIINAAKLKMEGEIKVTGCDEKFILSNEKNNSMAELTRLKRQFLNYLKLHPTLYSNKNMAGLFVQYLNTNM